ncbi:hypothetical protein SAMN06265365_110118 [Tistlia consotensis]|uniref:Uncharacterized protein n=1 Tax=Tistlia consotensis USBA 355 TaxID=560819 RepID=A0A1Y6BTP3_9PROT|nr:hypothetical protein [Tistlia consotensis]SMF26910.1 hypothetical protein SAMN05428998_10938 [Tistlia consotensis USBA 355]SNR66718.1 hypothetical protein SAMN06265365_110118 [Tistlia consotensis]
MDIELEAPGGAGYRFGTDPSSILGSVRDLVGPEEEADAGGDHAVLAAAPGEDEAPDDAGAGDPSFSRSIDAYEDDRPQAGDPQPLDWIDDEEVADAGLAGSAGGPEGDPLLEAPSPPHAAPPVDESQAEPSDLARPLAGEPALGDPGPEGELRDDPDQLDGPGAIGEAPVALPAHDVLAHDGEEADLPGEWPETEGDDEGPSLSLGPAPFDATLGGFGDEAADEAPQYETLPYGTLQDESWAPDTWPDETWPGGQAGEDLPGAVTSPPEVEDGRSALAEMDLTGLTGPASAGRAGAASTPSPLSDDADAQDAQDRPLGATAGAAPCEDNVPPFAAGPGSVAGGARAGEPSPASWGTGEATQLSRQIAEHLAPLLAAPISARPRPRRVASHAAAALLGAAAAVALVVYLGVPPSISPSGLGDGFSGGTAPGTAVAGATEALPAGTQAAAPRGPVCAGAVMTVVEGTLSGRRWCWLR